MQIEVDLSVPIRGDIINKGRLWNRRVDASLYLVDVDVCFVVDWGKEQSGSPHTGDYDPGCGPEVEDVGAAYWDVLGADIDRFLEDMIIRGFLPEWKEDKLKEVKERIIDYVEEYVDSDTSRDLIAERIEYV